MLDVFCFVYLCGPKEIFMGDAVVKLKTSDSFLKELKNSKKPTNEEVRKQRVSFVYGTLDSSNTMTRDQVKKILESAE